MNYLAGLKSTALSFHYSEGNNFIKLEQRLKLVKECVSVVWLKTSRLAMSLCKCSGGLWGPACARRRYYHIRERGEVKKMMKSVIVIGCAWREMGQNLWMRFPKASWGENWFSLLDGVVNAVKRTSHCWCRQLNEKLFRSMRRPPLCPRADYTWRHCDKGTNLSRHLDKVMLK